MRRTPEHTGGNFKKRRKEFKKGVSPGDNKRGARQRRGKIWGREFWGLLKKKNPKKGGPLKTGKTQSSLKKGAPKTLLGDMARKIFMGYPPKRARLQKPPSFPGGGGPPPPRGGGG